MTTPNPVPTRPPRAARTSDSPRNCSRSWPLAALGHHRATFIGHSLGGGVALQFAYQFPGRCERLVLVWSGGLGKEVGLLFRALSFPGAEHVLAPAVQSRSTAVVNWLRNVGIPFPPSL